MDGRLDESVYQTVEPITGFIQQIPDDGAPASERTEVWVLFDENSLYVTARAFDSAPPSEWVANEMRHDVAQLRQNHSFSLLLDTFHDRRNGVAFLVTPIGGYSDFAITNEGNVNTDWNVVWDMRTGRFEGGWTVEIEIPFKSLRYPPGKTQVWGGPRKQRDRRTLARVRGRYSRRPRSAATEHRCRDQALRDCGVEDRRQRRSADRKRHRCRLRCRREVPPHAEPDRRLYRQYRLRPGRWRADPLLQ